MSQEVIEIDRKRYDTYNEERLRYRAVDGLTKELVEEISSQKNEPEWMLNFRLKCLDIFQKLPMPNWGPSLKNLDLNKITYFLRPDAGRANNWAEVPEDIKKTFERLGIPEAERKALGGAGAQYESDVIYHNLKKEWQDKGVVFEDCDVGLQEYPELMKKYFMKCVPPTLHKFAALHGAVWSGGTFLFVPKGVKVTAPMQAYFRMNAKKAGQFEHTLIMVEEGAEVQYIEGCSAPQYGVNSLHAGCVEIFVHKNARARYSSIENWSRNTYNLNTKRAIVDENGVIEWINGNMGCLTGDSKVYTNPEGPVNISQLSAGSMVFSLDEKNKKFVKTKVKNMIFSGDKKVYRLRVAGREIKASSNHPFLVLRHETVSGNKRKGRFMTIWAPLEDLKEGDIIAISKSLPDTGAPYKLPLIDSSENKVKSRNQHKEFEMKTGHLYSSLTYPEYTDEDLMWFFGIYIGDGNLWKPKKGGAKINIAIHEKSDLRKPLLDTILRVFNYKVNYMEDRFIIINSNVLATLIEKLGFSGTAKTKRIPGWVFSLPKSQRMAFLAGLIDSDGHINQGGAYLTSISKSLLEGTQALAISCGLGVSRIFEHRKEKDVIILGNKAHANDSFRILLNGKRVAELPTRSMFYSEKLKKLTTVRNFSGKRGWNFKSKTSGELGFARIDSISYLGIEPTYDIEVEGHHNFVSNGIVVHNSNTTMLYPSSVLRGPNAKSDYIGVAFAGKGQHQDTGCKVYHLAPNTSSTIKAKSISKDGGITSYRGLLHIAKRAVHAKANVQCDALMMDNISKSNTFPYMDIKQNQVHVGHEATVGKISSEQIFYLMSRGLSKEQATQMIVSGFIEPVVKALPLEYAVELNRLIEMEMEGSLG